MTINNILLVIAALLPAVILCAYVFSKDRVEKEPTGLLMLLLVLGGLVCIPTATVETVMNEIINAVFSPFIFIEDGAPVIAGAMYYVYIAVTNFIGIALVEETFKFLVLVLITRNNKNFNSLFDGLIYSVFVSLGFAAFENVLYVLQYGWMNALMRGVMSVPGHMFFAVLMGYYYSFGHIHKTANTIEKDLKSRGYIPAGQKEISSGRYLVMAILMPTLAHGLYDYCCTSDTTLSTVVLYLFLIFLYIYCFGKIKKMSKADAGSFAYSSALVIMKYPHLAGLFEQKVPESQSPAEEMTEKGDSYENKSM